MPVETRGSIAKQLSQFQDPNTDQTVSSVKFSSNSDSDSDLDSDWSSDSDWRPSDSDMDTDAGACSNFKPLHHRSA
ncbi:hypothetical protein FRB93_008636 [Tulasnella sp. JGI-2019a]|nr:hypothetical protein FRB93_008636 [Tulasnella sp. JGI-2019a]